MITTGIVVANSGVSLLARLVGNDGRPITRASISSIAYNVYNETDGENVASGSGTLTISDVVFDDLQTNDPRWTKDSEASPGKDGRFGYNFLATLPASHFTADGNRLRVSITFTPASGQPFVVLFSFLLEAAYT